MKRNLTGTVKFYDSTKGFGFITCDGSNNEYFFHISKQVFRDDVLSSGVRVSFDEAENRKGLCAVNVERL